MNGQAAARPKSGHAGVAFFVLAFGVLSSFVTRHWSLRTLVLIALLPFPASAAANDSSTARLIGIEGRTTVTLPRGDYQARPLDDRTELILRIDRVTPLGAEGPFEYALHHIGFEPGSHVLAEFLVRPDGSRPDELGGLEIAVQALLPDEHDGQLLPFAPRRFPFVGGYRMFLGLLAVLWVAGLVAFVWLGRRKHVALVAAPVVPPPSLAERLRPLVEAAAEGRLGADGQARLERLLLAFWRERLRVPEARMADALQRLKAHPEAGALLRALESWLHRPGGVPATEVTRLLEPYRRMPAPETV